MLGDNIREKISNFMCEACAVVMFLLANFLSPSRVSWWWVLAPGGVLFFVFGILLVDEAIEEERFPFGLLLFAAAIGTVAYFATDGFEDSDEQFQAGHDDGDALGLRMVRCTANVAHPIVAEPISKVVREVT